MAEATKEEMQEEIANLKEAMRALEILVDTRNDVIEDLKSNREINIQRIEELEHACFEYEEEHKSLQAQLLAVVDEDLGLADSKKCPNEAIQRLQEALEHREVQFNELHSDYMEISIKSNTLRHTLQALLDAFDGPRRGQYTNEKMRRNQASDINEIYGTKG